MEWKKFTNQYPNHVSAISRDLQEGQLGFSFNDEILIMLSPYIGERCSLHSINFSPNSVTDKGLKALEEAEVDFKKLRSINLSNNVIKAEGLRTLTAMFPMPLLEELNLCNTKIMFSKDKVVDPIDFFSIFLQELVKCPKLKYLNLSSADVFSVEIVRLLADALPWMQINTFVFDIRLISKDEAMKILQILEAGLRWNLTITTFEMPFWLELADSKNDLCQRIKRYLIRNCLSKNNAELNLLREQLSVTKLTDNCTNIILDYLYKDKIIINILYNHLKRTADKGDHYEILVAENFLNSNEAFKSYEYERYLLELFNQYEVTDVKINFIPATPFSMIKITIAKQEILKLSQYIPESFISFINSTTGGTWVETRELHSFELKESYTEKQGVLEVKLNLENSLRERFEEIEEIFQVQEEKGKFIVKMQMTPREAISLLNLPQEVKQESKQEEILVKDFISKIMKGDSNLPGPTVFSDSKIQFLIGKVYQTVGNQQKAMMWDQAAAKNGYGSVQKHGIKETEATKIGHDETHELDKVPISLSPQPPHHQPVASEQKGLHDELEEEDEIESGYFEIKPSDHMKTAAIKQLTFKDDLNQSEEKLDQIDGVQPLAITLRPREPISLDSANLNKFFTSYFELIEGRIRGEHFLDFKEKELVYTLTHLEVFYYYIKNNEDYLPINEVNLLYSIFLGSSIDKNFHNYYVILFKYLEFMYDILKIRASNKKEQVIHNIDLNKMQEIMYRFEAVFFENETKKYSEIYKLMMRFYLNLEKTFKNNFVYFKGYFIEYKKLSDSIL